MKALTLIATVIFSLFYLNVLGQFTSKTEYEYLKLINTQNDKTLIKDNLKNTDMVLTSLINAKNDMYAPFYFNELAKSYRIIENDKLAFFFILVQRCLFPYDSLSEFQKNMFFETAYAINLDDATANKYWDATQQDQLPKNHYVRIDLLLELSTQLHFDQLTNYIYTLGINLQTNNSQIPAWYQHWEYLTTIGFNEYEKKNILTNKAYTLEPIFKQISPFARKKVYRKAIEHYTKIKAKVYANELIIDYKKQDLSRIEQIDLFIKTLWLKLK